MSKATNVRAELCRSGKDSEFLPFLTARPGGIAYLNDEGLWASCPCGCGAKIDLSTWTRTGPLDRPTLSPSVGIYPARPDHDAEADGFHWHGWLRDGVWRSC